MESNRSLFSFCNWMNCFLVTLSKIFVCKWVMPSDGEFNCCSSSIEIVILHEVRLLFFITKNLNNVIFISFSLSNGY